MKVVNENRRLLFVLKEKISGTLVVAPEGLVLVEESLQETPTPVDSRPYKVYTALLTQSGTDAPVATVLENTLGGEIVWSYDGVGGYIGTLNNTFFQNKTIFFGSYVGKDSINMFRSNNNVVEVNTLDSQRFASDDILQNTSIEIRVYN